MVNWRRVGAYFAAALVLTQGVMGVYLFLGGERDTASASAFGAIFIRACPGLVAIGFQRWVTRRPIVSGLEIRLRPDRWFVAGWLVPILWVLFALGLGLLLPGTHYAPDLSGMKQAFPGTTDADLADFRSRLAALHLPPLGALVLVALVVGPTLSALAAFGEEVAWRGWVLNELAPLGFWRSALVAGLLQAAWHFPFFFEGFYPVDPVKGCAWLVLQLGLQGILMAHLRRESRSVLPATLFHGTCGAAQPIAVALLTGGNPDLVGLGTLTGALALLPFVLAVALHRRLARTPSHLNSKIGPRPLQC